MTFLRKIALLALALALGSGAYGQRALRLDISLDDPAFGVKAAMNIASATVITDSKPRVAVAMGLWASNRWDYRWGTQVELLYSMQGVKWPFPGLTAGKDYVTRLDYLNVPILAQYYLTDKWRLELGPQLGFLVHSCIRQEIDGYVKEYKSGANKFDISVAGGVTWIMDRHFSFTGRYTFGLNYIGTSRVFPGNESKNTVIQLGVNYTF